MLSSIKMLALVAGVLIAASVVAQTPASAPAGSTGMCRDSSYWTGATKKGACHGHQGVKDWYGATDTAAAGNSTAAKPSASPAVATAAPPVPAAAKATNSQAVAAAPRGGAGQVWVNKSSKVYHCPSDRWYGKTKNGAYMSEADAIAQGNHADHGKACK